MRRSGVFASSLVFAVVLCSVMVLWVGTAAGRPDDVRVRPITKSIQKYLAGGEAQYNAWMSKRDDKDERLSFAPYWVLRTVSHKQLRNDWCGPATMAIIDHYLRGPKKHWSQQRWSQYSYDVNRDGRIDISERLWTDTYGAYPPMMAVGLKRVTGQGYSCYYFPMGSDKSNLCHLMSKTEYAVKVKKRPAAYSARIDPDRWTRYRYYHAGHIMACYGFDYRKRGFPVYVDDPYAENAPPPLGRGSSGGVTFGKRTYLAPLIADTMFYIVY